MHVEREQQACAPWGPPSYKACMAALVCFKSWAWDGNDTLESTIPRYSWFTSYFLTPLPPSTLAMQTGRSRGLHNQGYQGA